MASSPSGLPSRSYTAQASNAIVNARGSALPMSSLAMRSARRATYRGSQPPASMRHSQYKRGVRIAAAHRLVQRRYLVVEILAALVEAHVGAADHGAHGVGIQAPTRVFAGRSSPPRFPANSACGAHRRRRRPAAARARPRPSADAMSPSPALRSIKRAIEELAKIGGIQAT